MTLRTLGVGDAQILQGRVCRLFRSDHEWSRWTLAQSVWTLGGRLVDPDRVETVADFLGSLPVSTLSALFDLFFHHLVGRQDRARQASYVYVYERVSREMWRVYGARPWEHGGVEACRFAGDNPVQKWWVTYNQIEDVREQFQPHWRAYKLITSATSPKGVKKINEADDRQDQEEQDRREDALHRYFWYRAGKLDLEGYLVGFGKGQLGSRPFAGLKSVDDLEVEYRKWILGEQDDHDRIVQAYKERTLAEIEQRRNQMYQNQKPLMEEANQYAQEGPDFHHPYRADQLGQPGRKVSTWIPDVNASLYRPPPGRS